MSLESVLQVVISILTIISLGLVGWCLKSIVAIFREIEAMNARTEARREAVNQRINDFKAEVDRRLTDHKSEIDRRFNEGRVETSNQFTQISNGQARLEGQITAVHTRLDKFLEAKANGK